MLLRLVLFEQGRTRNRCSRAAAMVTLDELNPCIHQLHLRCRLSVLDCSWIVSGPVTGKLKLHPPQRVATGDKGFNL